MREELTRSDVMTRTTPIGMNVKPMIKNIGRAVFAVMMGCQAGKRCCLKAVSETRCQGNKRFTRQTRRSSTNQPVSCSSADLDRHRVRQEWTCLIIRLTEICKRDEEVF